LFHPRDCMSDRIRKVIVERICDGTYVAGQRLVELQIAREFETSQAPIREALCELEAMRIVETQPYKGTRVRQISSRELEESLQIRGVLEELAANQVEDRLLQKIDLLREKALETVEAAKESDARRYCAANLVFHRMIVEASENQTILMVWEMLTPEVRMLASVRANVDNLKIGAHEHLEVVDAFAEGDNRFAGKLLKIHTEKALVHNLKKEPDRQESY
jgi:DNA-binding GntR family transcriptional regulator